MLTNLNINTGKIEKTLICIIGPSGSGKTTVGNILSANSIPKLVTHTTRDKRVGELEGRDYWFVSREKFATIPMIETDDYSGNLYGTSWKELEEKFEESRIIYTVVTYSGYSHLEHELAEVKKICNVFPVYIHVDRDVCIKRLGIRGDSLADIQVRIRNYDKLDEFNNSGRVKGYTIYNNMDDITVEDSRIGMSLIDQVNKLLQQFGWFRS